MCINFSKPRSLQGPGQNHGRGAPVRMTPLPGSCPLMKDKGGPYPTPAVEELEPHDPAMSFLATLLLCLFPEKGPQGPSQVSRSPASALTARRLS